MAALCSMLTVTAARLDLPVACPGSVISMYSSPIPHFHRLCLGRWTAEKKPAEGFPVEGNQGPEIAEAAEGGGGNHGEQYYPQTDEEAGKPQEARGDDE